MARLESPSDLPEELGSRRQHEALQWLVDWLKRRDDVLDQIKVDDIAAALETIAAELRKEAAQQPSSASAGLTLAAAVLDDSAEGVRVGDELTADSVDVSAHAARADSVPDVTLGAWNNDPSAPPA